jgi:menaquinol-cytochrome c reductase iron-sulfur subunit
MSDTGTHRRRFLSVLAQALLAGIGLCLAIPSFAYIGSPLRRRRSEESPGAGFQDLGPVTDIPVNEWRLLSLEVVRENGWEKTRSRRSVWVRREGESQEAFQVLSPICPHLGCPITWHGDQKQFACPCHGGVFDSQGQLVSGPPPRAMDRLDFEVRSGRLWVRWQDFKIGVTTRVAVDI